MRRCAARSFSAPSKGFAIPVPGTLFRRTLQVFRARTSAPAPRGQTSRTRAGRRPMKGKTMAKWFVGNDRGQTSVEYLGIIAVVVAIVIAIAGTDIGQSIYD